MRRFLILLIRAYRYAISPYIAASCRFTPTCSSFAIEAVEKHGVFRGSWLAVRRISRCHPWHEGGHDPVPDVPSGKTGCCHNPAWENRK